MRNMEKHYHPETLKDELKGFHDEPLIRVVMLPKHTNALGTIFGGVVMSHLDLAAGEEAMKTAGRPVVTKLIKEVEFSAPVNVGDWVSFYTRTKSVGETSVTVQVLVVAQRGTRRTELHKVTSAESVFVAVDDDGNPVPVRD